ERLKPAIVHVRVRREAPTSTDDSQEPQERRASGSGFLIDPEGVIVTNAHVVEDVTTAQVRLFDGRRFTGKVIGRDSRVDLALLKLDGVNSMAARNGSIGFAIPSNVVKMLTPQLMAKGTVEWGWLGVSITEVGDDDVPRLKLRDSRGVLIRSVMPGEPADQGGVRPN